MPLSRVRGKHPGTAVAVKQLVMSTLVKYRAKVRVLVWKGETGQDQERGWSVQVTLTQEMIQEQAQGQTQERGWSVQVSLGMSWRLTAGVTQVQMGTKLQVSQHSSQDLEQGQKQSLGQGQGQILSQSLRLAQRQKLGSRAQNLNQG